MGRDFAPSILQRLEALPYRPCISHSNNIDSPVRTKRERRSSERQKYPFGIVSDAKFQSPNAKSMSNIKRPDRLTYALLRVLPSPQLGWHGRRFSGFVIEAFGFHLAFELFHFDIRICFGFRISIFGFGLNVTFRSCTNFGFGPSPRRSGYGRAGGFQVSGVRIEKPLLVNLKTDI